MRALNVQAGDRYSRLVVIGEAAPAGVKRQFRCRCDCGNISTCQLSNLRMGYTTSCGCFHRERCREVLAPYRFGARG